MIIAAALFISSALFLICLYWPLGIGVDYMNHLARVHIEREINNSQFLSEYYNLAPGNIPDLIMDIVIGYGLQSSEIYLSGSIMIFIAIMALPLAGLFLAYKTHGKLGLNHILVFSVAFPLCLRMGFINFQISLGLALFLYCFWENKSDSIAKSIIFSLSSTILYFFHALGFLIFGLLIVCSEAGNMIELGVKKSKIPGLLLKKLAPIFFIPLILLILTIGSSHGVDKSMNLFGDIEQRINAFSSAFGYGYTHISYLIIIILCIYIKKACDFTHLKLNHKFILLGLLLTTALMPCQFLGITYLEIRYAPLLFVFVFALAAPVNLKSNAPIHLAIVSAIILAGLLPFIKTISRIDSVQSLLRNEIAQLADGTRLIAGMSDDYLESSEREDYVHSYGVHVIENDGFITTLFTNTSPVKVNSKYKHLQSPQGFPLLDEDISVKSKKYKNWRKDFDYLLWMRSEKNQYSSLQNLKIIREKDEFIIYKIQPAQ